MEARVKLWMWKGGVHRRWHVVVLLADVLDYILTFYGVGRVCDDPAKDRLERCGWDLAN